MTKRDFIKSALIAGLLWSVIGVGVMIIVVQTMGQEVCSE